jgi:hypothetical protein
MPDPIINRSPARSKNPWERAYQLLQPLIIPTLMLIPGEEFTSRQFVTYLRATNPGEEAYQLAVSGWPDNLLQGRQTVHGQILPQLLRESGKVEWAGYVYDDPEQDDGLSVPSYWLKLS